MSLKVSFMVGLNEKWVAVSGRKESSREDSELSAGLKSEQGAVELFARSATSGDPSESRLCLVALRGVMRACSAPLSIGYAYVPRMS